MERTLHAVDELSGFIVACAMVRPEGIIGLTPKSVRKKLKQPSFAAAVNREELQSAADELGVPFDEHVAFVIAAFEPPGAAARDHRPSARMIAGASSDARDERRLIERPRPSIDGTPTVKQPAATAAATPVGESSSASVRAGSRAERRARGEVDVGRGLGGGDGRRR